MGSQTLPVDQRSIHSRVRRRSGEVRDLVQDLVQGRQLGGGLVLTPFFPQPSLVPFRTAVLIKTNSPLATYIQYRRFESNKL
jgi:hypothetical protein